MIAPRHAAPSVIADRTSVIAASSRNPGLHDRTSVIAASSRNPEFHDTSIHWLDPDQGDNILDAIISGYSNYFETVRRDPSNVEAIFRAFNQFRVLCAVREGTSGSNWINEQVARRARKILSEVGSDQPHDPRSPWYLGRPVMVLRNDYVLKLFNGDIGLALPDDTGELAVFFPDGENGFSAVPVVRMPPHETAFAMTVHKAQGSEFDTVLVLLPHQGSRVATRELLYTAVTRARSRTTLGAGADTLTAAIESRSRRHSGLPARFGEAAVRQD